jgi:hypothetical protein
MIATSSGNMFLYEWLGSTTKAEIDFSYSTIKCILIAINIAQQGQILFEK